MENLLHSSVSEESITSTDHSDDNNEDNKEQGDSISKETKQRLVGTVSRRQDCKRSEPQILEFEDSRAVLDAVYQQWLLEKKAKIKKKKIQETKSKSMLQDEEAKCMAKKEQLKADAVKAYDKWIMKKDEDLVKKLKMKQQEKGTFTFLIKHTGFINEP